MASAVAGVCVCLGVVGSVLFFFFFQAEDGIRDLTVTGVQTCLFQSRLGSLPAASGRKMTFAGTTVLRVQDGRIAEELRSEERRVGKEGRSGWVPRRVERQRQDEEDGRRQRQGADEVGGWHAESGCTD